MHEITETARTTPIIATADIVVLGGGPAGIAAAIAAARMGAKTILIERYGFLGGSGTAAMVTNFCGLHALIDGEVRQLVHGIADDVLDRIDHYGGLNEVHTVLDRTAAQSFDISAYKLAADDLLLNSGVDILFHCPAVDTVVEDDHIRALIVETKSGRGAVAGRYFIDCSGDGDLAHFAGVPWKMGDENGFIQLPTLMFTVTRVDSARAMAEGKPNLSRLMEEAMAGGTWEFTRTSGVINPQPRNEEWRINLTQVMGPDNGPFDGTDVFHLTHGEIEGRRQVANVFRFLKECVPGFENSSILEIAPQLGIRETRRIVGSYALTEDDVLGARDFPDTIGVNGWPVERHVQGTVEWKWIEGRGFHQIPFRCLVPEAIRNLLVAGRCASVTAEALASVRVSGPCFVMGQAAGTAAALNVGADTPVKDTDVSVLQDHLRQTGVFLG